MPVDAVLGGRVGLLPTGLRFSLWRCAALRALPCPAKRAVLALPSPAQWGAAEEQELGGPCKDRRTTWRCYFWDKASILQ